MNKIIIGIGAALILGAVFVPSVFGLGPIGGVPQSVLSCGADGQFNTYGYGAAYTLQTPCGPAAIPAGGASIGYSAGWNTFIAPSSVGGVPFGCWLLNAGSYAGTYNELTPTILLDLPGGLSSSGAIINVYYTSTPASSSCAGALTLPSSTTVTQTSTTTRTTVITQNMTSTSTTTYTTGASSTVTSTTLLTTSTTLGPGQKPGFGLNYGEALGAIVLMAGVAIGKRRG